MILLMLGFIGWYASGYWLGQRLLRSERFEGINEERRSRGIFLAVLILLWTGIIAGVIALMGGGAESGACKFDGGIVVGEEEGHCVVQLDLADSEKDGWYAQVLVIAEDTNLAELEEKAIQDRQDADISAVSYTKQISVDEKADLSKLFEIDSESDSEFLGKVGFRSVHIIPQIIWMIVIYGSLFSLVLFAVRILRRRFTGSTNIFTRQ